MKIKGSDSAAKNKLFLGFWFVLFAILILIVNWLVHLPVARTGEMLTNLATTENMITRLTALHAEYLLSTQKEDNLVIVTRENIQQESRTIIRNIQKNLEALRNYRQLGRKPEMSSSLDELSQTLTSFESNLENLMLITHERGDINSGPVNRWLGLSRQMITSTGVEKDILQRLNQIKFLESEYLLRRDIRSLQDISMLAEEIRNQITMEETGININDLDTYMVLTGNLVSIEKRMGHSGAEGIIPDLEKSIQQLPVKFDVVNRSLNEHIEKVKLYWIITRYTVIPIFIAFSIFLFLRTFSLIDPLRQVAAFARKLAAGEFPEEDIAVGNLADMQSVKESLQKHVATLRDKFEFTQMMNQDRLDSKLDLSGEKDFLGNELMQLRHKILETHERQVINDQENQVRRYINEGLAKFGEILRTKNNDMHVLGDAFICEIVKYMNGLQGGFFLYDDSDASDPMLNLISAFAYNRKKYLQNSIKLGEGLVGSCAREKQYMNLTEIPKGYIAITSGLGDTPPNNLLLVPVMHENELLGVIEIASLNKFQDHEIDFALEVALNLGTTLVNTRNNQRTTELLTKSQQQALEMAEQEEEMRQNMEELKATQEESGRREEELRGIAEAVSRSLMIVEYNLEGRIHEVNENLCRFLGKEADEIIGKFHHEVFEGSLKTDPTFWNEVQHNGHLNVTEKLTVGKNSISLVEHFATVTNRGNITVKFINFASDGRIGNS